jgi:hypothetical protein
MTMSRPAHGLLFTAPLLLAIGCATTSSPFMRPSETQEPLHAPLDQAVVVFVRPSGFAFLLGANILDENGRFLGDSMAESYFAVRLKPGRHMFTVWAENTDAITADLAPGRIYYVEVAPTMGAWSAQMHLRAIKPGLPSWPRLSEWMGASKRLVADLAAGQENLDRRASDVAERLRRAREHLAEYHGQELVQHSLRPEDGVGG